MRQSSAGLMVVLALLVSSCSATKPNQQAPSSTDRPVIGYQPAGFNADDVAFASNMIASYGQTTDLTALVPVHSTNPDLVALAAEVGAAQGPQLQTVKVLLVQWNSTSDNGSSQGGPGGVVPGTVDDATMAGLGSLSGKEFDALWLRSMIGHQQGAIAVSRDEVAKGTNVDAVATAKRLVGTYQSQIARMQQLLG